MSKDLSTKGGRDVVNDSTTRYSDIRPVWGAAFAPDSHRLVVQIGHDAWIVTVDGQRMRPVALEGMDLISGTAWSPDSALIAVTNGGVMGFVDATGAGREVPGHLPYRQLLGWRGPASVLAAAGQDGGDLAVTEVNIHTGQHRLLSRFSMAQVCEYGLRRRNTYLFSSQPG